MGALIQPREQWLRNESDYVRGTTPTPIRKEAELKYVPLRSLIECRRCRIVSTVKMNVLAALNQFTLLWEDRVQIVTRAQSLLPSCPGWKSIRLAGAAVKARDELASLGLDGSPRQPNNSNYPGHKGNKQKRTCPDHRGTTKGNGVYTELRTLPMADALDTIQHLCRKGSMFRLGRPPRRP